MTAGSTAAPATPRWRRRILIGIAAVATVAALGTPWWGPRLLRPLAFFRVRRIDVRGVRYASPSEIARVLAIDTTRSVWDDLAPLVARVKKLPQVRDVEIERDLPGALVVSVEENLPIALAPSPNGMRAFDEDGRALDLDPSRTPLDLPVIPKRDTTMLRLLGEVRASNPSLFARISELRRTGRDELTMQLVTLPVRMMADVTMERLDQISSVEEDLARRRAHAVELDLRFRDQVIARIQ